MDSNFVFSSFSARKMENYKIYAKLEDDESISIALVNENNFSRFSRIFPKEKIEKLTESVGSQKPVKVFWKLVSSAIQKTSKQVSFFVLQETEIDQILSVTRMTKKRKQNKKGKTNKNLNSDNKMSKKIEIQKKIYLFIHMKTEFENIYYPLVLKENKFSDREMLGMLVSLSKENKKLKTCVKKTENQKYIIQQVATLESKVKRMEMEKAKLQEEIMRKKMLLLYRNDYDQEAHEFAKYYRRKQIIQEIEKKREFPFSSFT